jgi:hypothetical protein
MKAKWIGHILLRDCLLRHVTEGNIEGRKEVMVRRGRRRKQLLDDLKEKGGYFKLKEETHSLQNLLWKRLRMCCKTDYSMDESGEVCHKLVSCSTLLRYIPDVKNDF